MHPLPAVAAERPRAVRASSDRESSAPSTCPSGDLANCPVANQSGDKLRERRVGIDVHHLADLYELNYIQSAFPAFQLGHEGLSIPDPFAQFGLRQTSLLAKIAKQEEQRFVVTVMSRACHTVAGLRHRTLESVLG